MVVFSRSVALPDGLKADKAEATLEDGILTLVMPKAEEVKPRTIKVMTKDKSGERSTIEPKPKAEVEKR